MGGRGGRKFTSKREVNEGEAQYIFGYSQVSDFIPPSVRVCRPNARTAAQELKELEVGRINQIGCGAPSVR